MGGTLKMLARRRLYETLKITQWYAGITEQKPHKRSHYSLLNIVLTIL